MFLKPLPHPSSMTQTTLDTALDEAQQALNGFLGTLLGDDEEMVAEDPTPMALDALRANKEGYLLAVGTPEGEAPPFVVMLAPSLVPLISEPMIGEAMTPDDSGAADLLQEIGRPGVVGCHGLANHGLRNQRHERRGQHHHKGRGLALRRTDSEEIPFLIGPKSVQGHGSGVLGHHFFVIAKERSQKAV